MRKIVFYYIVLSIVLISVTRSAPLRVNRQVSPQVKLTGDTLSVHASNAPLQTILTHLTNYGIIVSIDPQINPKISAHLKQKSVQEGLAAILKPLNYVMVWETIERPSGAVHKLSEIQIFKPGEKKRMRPLNNRSDRTVSRSPIDGSVFVKDEILFRIDPDLTQLELERLLNMIGGTLSGSNAALGIYKIKFPEDTDVLSLVDTVSNYPGIAKVEPNYVYAIHTPQETPNAPSITADLSNLSDADDAVPIAILDSGFSEDAGLEDFVLTSFNAINPDASIADSLGHGTQMALVAAGAIPPIGAETSSDSYSPIIPIKAIDDSGVTSSFDIMRSIDFALANGARVMSLSWGTETKSEFLEDAVNYASSKGVIVVASAGNEPTGTPVYPAAYSSVIGVGALGPEGDTWVKSNYGSFVAFNAPGFAVLPVGHKGDPGAYAGTSIAAAYTSNIISNYLSQNPQATFEEIVSALKDRF